MEPTILKVQFYGAISFLTEPTLIILLGKDHIHVKKQAKVKPDCEHFLKEIKQLQCTLLETEKLKRLMKHCHFNLAY